MEKAIVIDDSRAIRRILGKTIRELGFEVCEASDGAEALQSDIEDFNWGLEQVRVGRIKPLLDHTLPLSKAAEAHRLISTGQVTGNLVLLPWTE